MLFELSAAFLGCVLVLPAIFHHIEQQQYWTLRLKISCLLPWRSITAITAIAFATVLRGIVSIYDIRQPTIRLLVATSLTVFATIVFRFLLPLAGSREYVQVRWKAWTGPSRSGIPPHLADYLGTVGDWRTLARIVRDGPYAAPAHPVEKYLSALSLSSKAITLDATAILLAILARDETLGTGQTQVSGGAEGVYAPSQAADRAVSLLWGPDLGFEPRCSRGIIAVPLAYLSHSPVMPNGLDARAICLAYGIAARNKGLAPRTLICGLQTRETFRQFEENSILWPRPAKTLRSHYREEFTRSFAGLGEAYITAITELALLIADTKFDLLGDWLGCTMEQQDLALNNQIANLGATDAELDMLYRGQYCAMLVGLSLHRRGINIRPELTVFEHIWQQYGQRSGSQEARVLPDWTRNEALRDRRQRENEILGARGLNLIQAVI